MEVKKTRGLGRTCAKCHIAPGQQEECVEVDGKIYHTHHNPTKEQKNCRVGKIFDSAHLWTSSFVH